mmetsp:Transcript_10113/g.24740  ORF Transcript_10113/g.24740 Transcript_10113/m.24740 type:complete len:139 (-) Transcript_10113:374-790(-)
MPPTCGRCMEAADCFCLSCQCSQHAMKNKKGESLHSSSFSLNSIVSASCKSSRIVNISATISCASEPPMKSPTKRPLWKIFPTGNDNIAKRVVNCLPFAKHNAWCSKSTFICYRLPIQRVVDVHTSQNHGWIGSGEQC